jgi:cytochrome c oxidase subunit IV
MLMLSVLTRAYVVHTFGYCIAIAGEHIKLLMMVKAAMKVALLLHAQGKECLVLANSM